LKIKPVLINTIPDKTFAGEQPIPKSPAPGSVFLKKKWFYHTVFWIVYFLFISITFFNAYGIHDIWFYFQLLAFMPFSIGLVYFNNYTLIPALLHRKKYLYYALALCMAILTASFADQVIKKYYVHIGLTIFTYTSGLDIKSLFSEAVGLFYLMGFTTSIKISKDWITNQQRQQEREKQYLETELNFLKTQIHPHFFFNTLNNLYSLTLKKSDQAPEVVLKLSALMSYMLYESNTAKVSLNKEISYLQNYLDLEKLRFGQRIYIVFEIEGQIEDVTIPPMLLILFIENSFKHGIKNNVNKIRIDISLKVEGGWLFFMVKNPLGDRPVSRNAGIGLKNAARRLDLLYGSQYQLDLSEKDNEFTVSLKIPV
jgi:two-component system, LytTR family, sensor kinase